MEATLDLQNDTVRRYEAYARCKALRAGGEPLQSLLYRFLATGGLDEVHTDPELG